MELMREWAFSLCCCMVVGSLLYMLAPSKNLAKIFQTTISLFILCCIITPFAFGNIDFGEMIPDVTSEQGDYRAGDLNETINDQIMKAMEDTLTLRIKSILKSFGIEKSKIAISMNVDDKSSISINHISLILPDSFLMQDTAIRRDVEKEIGILPETTYVKEVYEG